MIVLLATQQALRSSWRLDSARLPLILRDRGHELTLLRMAGKSNEPGVLIFVSNQLLLSAV